MARRQDLQDVGEHHRPPLTADECRLTADRFLDHLATDPVGADMLTYLAGRLYAVAVQVEQHASLSLIECGVSGASSAPEVTRPEGGRSAARRAV